MHAAILADGSRAQMRATKISGENTAGIRTFVRSAVA